VRGRVHVTRQVGEQWIDNCLIPLFQKKNSIIVWGGILGARSKKVLVLWERDDWGTITAQTYVDHILVAFIWPFWHQDSVATGRTLKVMECGALAHRAHYIQV
jgi:hypothetical protein